MGFMDKAKQMADQAQKKIEETQKQFNDSQSQKAGGGGAAGVRYDAHGRPIQEPGDTSGPPASTVPAPPVEPVAPAGQPGTAPPASDPAVAEAVAVPQPPEGAEVPQPEGEQEETPVPPPAPPKDGVNASPDPFKPIQ